VDGPLRACQMAACREAVSRRVAYQVVANQRAVSLAVDQHRTVGGQRGHRKVAFQMAVAASQMVEDNAGRKVGGLQMHP